MKVLIVLALAVATVSAGFSGSLVKQAQPILQQAIQQIRTDLAAKTPARNSAEANFQTEFVDALNNQAQQILGAIETGVALAQNVAQGVVSSLHNAVAQLQALGSSIVDNGQQILSNLLSSIVGNIFSGGNGRALPPALAAIVAQVASNPDFVALVHNSDSDSSECLKANGLTISLQWLQQVNAAGGLNAGLLDHPAISKCLEEGGGLHAVISGSAIVDWVQQLAGGLGMSSLIHGMIIQAVGPELGWQIVDALTAQGRGIFGDAWNAISGAASNAWGNLSQGVSSVGQYIASVASQVYQSAAEKFEAIKKLAQAFIQGGITTAQLATQQAAEEFLVFLAPYQQDMGALYQQVVAQISGIYNNIQLPSWQARRGVRAF